MHNCILQWIPNISIYDFGGPCTRFWDLILFYLASIHSQPLFANKHLMQSKAKDEECISEKTYYRYIIYRRKRSDDSLFTKKKN